MTETNAVAIKLPTFWAQQPEVWFLQAEAQFHIRKIKDDTAKYYHVVAALDQETSGRVLDTLSAPPANNKYTNLKQRLLTTFGHISLITRTLKCEVTDYNVLYCYVLCTELLYWYTILMCWIKSVATQFLKSDVVILFIGDPDSVNSEFTEENDRN